MQKNKTNIRFFIWSILSIIIIIGLSACNVTGNKDAAQKQDTLYDHVIKSGKIRVGYVTYPPGCIKDPNTGKLSGIFVETLEEAGKNLGLKIEWTEEVGWGTMIEGLQANRYDMIGSPVWANTTRAKLVDFSTPLFYSGIGAYVRKTDNRFSASLDAINSEKIKISTIDGEMSDIISRSQFPKAQIISHPQLSDNSQILLDVAQGRADLTFVEPYIANQFLKSNKETIKNISAEKPIRIFPNTMMFKKGQSEFKSMLDTAVQELINSGFVDKLITKYEEVPGSFYRVNYPYRLTK
jgi:polar amino acid transport system substrate-binding protein